MTEKISVKLSFFSFWLIVAVVLLHAFNVQKGEDTWHYAWLVENFLSNKLAQVAVPLFFFISGYLFFYNLDFSNKFDIKVYAEKWKKRFSSVVIPYVFWCLFWYIFIGLFQLFPITRSYFLDSFFSEPIAKQAYIAFIQPAYYPFWFIRELLSYFLIAPVIFLAIKNFRYFFLIALLCCSLFLVGIGKIGSIHLYRYFFLFFFCSGAYMALWKYALISTPNTSRFAYPILFTWFFLSSLSVYLEKDILFWQWIKNAISTLGILSGCIGLWLLYDLVDRKYPFLNKKIYSYSFFIFATHGILLVFLHKACIAYFQPNSLGLILLYFGSIALISVCCLAIGMLINSKIPALYSLITGNRGNRNSKR